MKRLLAGVAVLPLAAMLLIHVAASQSLPLPINAGSFGFSNSASGAVNNSALQSAINAAAALGPGGAIVWVPTAGAINAFVYVPSNVKIQCGGKNNTLTKATAGPLFVYVDTVGDTWSGAAGGSVQSIGQKFEDCAIDNNQLAGTGILIDNSDGTQLLNVSVQNSKPGAAFPITTIANGIMTAGTPYRGTIALGDMVICAGCGTVSGTTGSGAAGQNTITFTTFPTGISLGALVSDPTAGGGNAFSTSSSKIAYVKSFNVAAKTVTLTQNIGNNWQLNAAGSGYGINVSGTMTWAGSGCTVPPVLSVSTNSSGAITPSSISVATLGVCSTPPSSSATTWTPGGGLSAGSNATFIPGTAVTSGDTVNFNSNTYSTITTFGSGSGGAGTYNLSGSVNISSAVIGWTAAPWTWTNGPPQPAYCGQTGTCVNSIFPTAEVSLIGGDGQVSWLGGFIGGSVISQSNESDCGKVSPQALWFDSYQTDGGNKPNQNDFTNVAIYCSDVGKVINNGSDNTFINNVNEYDIIARAYGLGPGGTNRTFNLQEYDEGQATYNMIVEAIYGSAASSNQTVGVGSLSYVTAQKEDHDTSGGGGTSTNTITQMGSIAVPQPSYTPTITCSGGGSLGAYSNRTGTYQVVGKSVTVSIDIQAAAGSCVAPLVISLPLASNSSIKQALIGFDQTTATTMVVQIPSGSTTGNFYTYNGNNPAVTDRFQITGSYQQ